MKISFINVCLKNSLIFLGIAVVGVGRLFVKIKWEPTELSKSIFKKKENSNGKDVNKE
jgi:hypothetical protein